MDDFVDRMEDDAADADYHQGALFPDLVPVTYQAELTTRERFEGFHRANPWVLEAMRQVAVWRRRNGWVQWSIAGVFEECRYGPLNTRGIDAQAWKLPNDFKPHYARRLMSTTPELKGFFQVHRLDCETPDTAPQPRPPGKTVFLKGSGRLSRHGENRVLDAIDPTDPSGTQRR